MAAPMLENDDSYAFIFDRRTSDAPEIQLYLAGLNSFNELKGKVKEVLELSPSDEFVITTTNREEVNSDDGVKSIEKGDTLYILTDVNQELSAPTQERVDYLPHYDTIVKGGMYEYYASEGQNPLPYAFAELIDNSLAATALNDGERKIEMRLYVDDSSMSRNCIVFIDNGKGMTPRQLNNWAIYRLSKFTRRADGESSKDDSVNLAETWAPRYMNSDISYFGVGGKQAIFFIGNAARMISKPKGSKDVHELMISKDDFEKKEKNKQSIYTGFIRNRKPGDASHIPADEELLHRLIGEEENRESFTAVVIQGIGQQHIPFLKMNFKMWTRQLAHIYHFYLHGPDGNKAPDGSGDAPPSNPFNNINIKVSVQVRSNPNLKTIDLRTVEDDMQSQYIRTAADVFEFKAHVDSSTVVEGIIRYHPFRFDRETYPQDIYGLRIEPEAEDDHGYAINNRPARGRRPIFETYWNGRLIPYTLIEEFDWCSLPKKPKHVPSECYNRISGVLWSNDSFQVSTNKLTFLDLEMKLRDKSTNFFRIINGHEKRTQIEREFQAWLKDCSEVHDKQILFSGNMGLVKRDDQSKHRQMWTKFAKVEWDGKVYEKGQIVRILRTMPVLHGTIKALYLCGEFEDNVYAMGGDIEIAQEPRSLYTEVKFVPLNRLDRGANALQVKKYIEDEEAKLPDHLLIHWPNGMEVEQNDKRLAGKTIGDMKVEICNKKGEKISKMPGSAAGSKKLLVELKLIWHSPLGDEITVSLLSQHGKTWPYWFRKMDSAKNLGNYTLQFHAVLNESGAVMYADRELPAHRIKFSVIEAEPEKFTVGMLDGPFKVGEPFQIPLEFQDRFNNATRPPSNLKPILDADGLELSYENMQTKGTSCFIKGVVAKGTVTTNSGKSFNLKVSIPDLEKPQTLKIRLLPGPPAILVVKPETEVVVENGSAPSFYVECHDLAGNLTSGAKVTVVCKLTGASGLPSYSADCSSSGSGTLTGKPIQMKKMKGDQELKAQFDIQGMRHVPSVERIVRVAPSATASIMRLYFIDGKASKEIMPKSTLERKAGTMLEGLSFKIFNEAGNELDIDDKMAAKIKVNWAPKVSRDMAMHKMLPSIKVPIAVSDVRYSQASVADASWIEVPFNVKAIAGDPTHMEYVVQGDTTSFKGEAMKAVIIITVKDMYENAIGFPSSESNKIDCTSQFLRKDAIVIQQKNNSFHISNLIFDSMGSQVISISFRGMVCNVSGFKVLTGPPSQLSVPGWTGQETSAHSDKPLLQSFKVQLKDPDGEDTHVAGVKVHIAKDAKLKLYPMPSYIITDEKGVADFGIFTPTANSGKYELQPKAIFERAVINGPKLILSIEPDPHKAKEISVSFNVKATSIAGLYLPDFNVVVMAENNKPLSIADTKNMKMKMWKREGGLQNNPPNEVVSIQAVENGPGNFVFKKCRAPDISGSYNFLFLFDSKIQQLPSSVISLTVNPGSPTELVALDQLPTTTVSNTRSLISRTLLKSLRLGLQDEFANSLGKGFNGKVKVEIISPGSEEEVPQFVSGSTSMEFSLVNGQCILQNLTLQENTAGKDGMEYHLSCCVVCDMIPKNQPLKPLILPFLFYNDAKKQQQMAGLSRERDALHETIKAFRSMFETQQQLVSEFRAAVHEAQKEEQALRADLRKQNIPSNQLQSVETVEKLIQVRNNDRDKLVQTPRRSCSLPQAERDPDVLGKIAHLALVHRDDIATVLSWHMSADMDCVITLTTQKAKALYSRTQGKQQVLPLDSIYRKNLPDWEKPLPHVRFRPSYKPPGNPVYARNLLEFTQDEDSCKVVFGMLLGDTLILDNLDQANLYRQEIVKYTHCPTILTRSGDRIRSNGKFGGAMNKAPSVEKLKGCIFGQPLPIAYHAVCTQIETLNKYKMALSTHIQTQDELQEQVNLQKLPETLKKVKECKEAESRLKEVEHKLGMGVPIRGTKTLSKSSSTPSSDEPVLKRPKLEPGATPSPTAFTLVNRTSPKVLPFDPLATPSRTSLRIASMTTVVSDDGRRRLKKTS